MARGNQAVAEFKEVLDKDANNVSATDGIGSIYAAFHLVLVPGVMLVIAVMSINVFGDGLRDALDPRAKVRIAH